MSEIKVVIPCYNLGEYVGEAVGSVLSQKGADVKVVLIDDGSDDRQTIRKLVELGRSDRVKLIRTENRGVAAARNNGLDESQSKYICFLDADDRLLPGALKTMSSALDAKPQAALVYPAFKLMSDSQTVHRPAWNRLALLYTNTLSVPSLVRRSAIGDARFRTTECGFEYEDWDFWLQITHKAPALHVPKALYEYRVRVASRGRQGNCHHQEVIDDLRRFNSGVFCSKNLMELKRKWCPAVNIIVVHDDTYKKWEEIIFEHPYLDAEVLRASCMPEVGIDRREQILGKYILCDRGKSAPDHRAFSLALKACEYNERPDSLPDGWEFSIRSELDSTIDPTGRLASQFAVEENIERLSQFDEKLWRLSCPAWLEKQLPENPEDLAGESGRAKYLASKLGRLKMVPYVLYGAGQHTKRLLEKDSFQPRPEVIFDDDPPDKNIMGVRVEKPGSLTDIQAVVISSDAHERRLYQRAQEIFPKDLPLLRLYS